MATLRRRLSVEADRLTNVDDIERAAIAAEESIDPDDPAVVAALERVSAVLGELGPRSGAVPTCAASAPCCNTRGVEQSALNSACAGSAHNHHHKVRTCPDRGGEGALNEVGPSTRRGSTPCHQGKQARGCDAQGPPPPMPPNLSIGEGIVYDSFGDESGQTDIVIANGDQPFTFPVGESGEYAIEGVSAVGEIKSNLTAAELTNCIEKATKYKHLRQIVGRHDQIRNLSPYTRGTSVLPPFFVIPARMPNEDGDAVEEVA